MCRTCGVEDCLWHQGECSACALLTRLDGLLGDRAANGMQPLFDRLIEIDEPRGVLDWLTRRGSSAQVIARFAHGELPLDHAAFDQLPAGRSSWFTERLLVTAGVLPSRDPVLARFERWCDDRLATVADAADARLLRRFVTWQLIRPLRDRANQGPLSDAIINGSKMRLVAADRFLVWLREERQRVLAGCTQPDVDAWANGSYRSWHQTRSFLSWARRQRLVADLEFPSRRAPTSPVIVNDDARWQLARRLLHDDDIPGDIRVAGLLVVLYAQPVTRLVLLTTGHVTVDGGAVAIKLSRTPIRLAEPLAGHLTALTARRRPHSVGQLHGPTPWLFPGHMAGRPTHATAMSDRLRRYGVSPSQHRVSALAHAASTMPAAIVADLLGVNIATATRWAELTGRSWADYVAHRPAPHPNP